MKAFVQLDLASIESVRIIGSAINHILNTDSNVERDDDGEVFIPERTVRTLSILKRSVDSIVTDHASIDYAAR